MGTVPPSQLSSLSKEDCQLLFMQRAFGNKEANPNLVPIGKEIVKKCGGVPVAAKTLGSILRFKREEREWKHVRDSEIWSLPQDETSILPALRLSYHHLPLNLRQCFAYCAVYPKDTKMEKGSMITLWIAHGFLSSKGNLELEDVGNEVWNELYLRSFFQEIEKSKFGETYFMIHDLIHDLATSLISANTSSNNIRQLKVGTENIMCIGFNEVLSSYSPSLFERFVSLRVLDLSKSDIEKLPSSIGDLVHLRFLDLSRNHIRSLPKRLCKLQNLQTLNLSGCKISCLPKQISKLCSLRILLLKGCPLTSMPPRIRSLACLKTLDYFVVGERNGCQLGELQNLNLGGSLSITHLERVKKIMDAKGANLSAKANIYSLCMSWDHKLDLFESQENIDEKVLEALEPHPNLESLEIIGFRGSGFPDWMIDGTVLENVTSIKIDDCMKRSCLPPFGKLPRLERLWLRYGDAEYVEQDVHSTRRFPSMRLLFIEGFPNLKGLVKKGGEENFSKLEEMEITCCPSFIFPTISSVKKLIVWGDTDATNLSSISNLTSLTSLSICHNPAASLPEEMFKSLPNLKSLKIEYFRKLKELPISLVSLTALTDLKIGYCDALECLPEQGLEGLTSLQTMMILKCPQLQALPASMTRMKNLQLLQIFECEKLTKRCERGMGEDWQKIAHILCVCVS